MRIRVADRVDVPGNLSFPYTGDLDPGDEFDVDDGKGEALLATHDYLEEVETEQDLNEMSKEDLYELAQERDIAGRSEMSKSDLLDALE